MVEAPQEVSLPSTLPMVKHTHRYVVKLEDTSMVALMNLGVARTALNLTMSREFQSLISGNSYVTCKLYQLGYKIPRYACICVSFRLFFKNNQSLLVYVLVLQ